MEDSTHQTVVDLAEPLSGESIDPAQMRLAGMLLNSMSDFAFLKDPQGRYIAINRAAATAVGKSPEEVLGKSDHDLFPAEVAARYMQDDLAVLSTGQSLTFVDKVMVAGEVRQFQTVKNICRDASGQVVGVMGVARDITELKKLETALRLREKDLQEAHRIAKLGTWHWDIFTDTITWSEQVYKVFRRDLLLPPPTYEELAGYHTAASLKKLHDAVQRAVEAGESYEMDLELVRPDGTIGWIIARGEVAAREDGKVTQLRGTIQDITDRKRSAERVALSESRYRSLIKAASEIVWTTTPEGNQINELPEWQALTGQTREEVLGFGWANAIHPEDREETIVKWKEAIASGTNFEVEHRLRRYDGSYRNMAVRAVPVRDSSGNILEWVGMHVDITERKTVEAALRQSESRFRKLFESDMIGIAIPDRFGAFIEGNDHFLKMVGYTRGELEAGLVRWDTMTPGKYRELDAAHIAEAAVRGSCTPYEKEYIRKDGSIFPILCGYALLQGSTDQYIGFVLDLTRQKQAEVALREREQRFRALAESLPQLVWETDAAGQNIYCNQRMAEYTGLSLDELMGWSWTEKLFHPDDLQPTIEKWRYSIQAGEPYTNEYRLRRNDGVYRYFLARGVPIRNEAGEIERWLGSSTDVHDQRIAEEALRRSEKLAATGRLAASVAHEINNPLAAVTNTLYLALNDPSLSQATRSYLQLAEQELARVVHVTTQTLRFHRQASAAAAIDISTIMDSVLSLFAPRLKACAVEVIREYKTGTPLYCYNDELRQVFANLISNSLDALLNGGRLRLRIEEGRCWDSSSGSCSAKKGIRVVVADTGQGIPSHLRTQIFEPFFSTKEATGTGLGLWVSLGIIQKHGGSIKFKSKTASPHRGTVFALFFPFDAVSQDERFRLAIRQR